MVISSETTALNADHSLESAQTSLAHAAYDSKIEGNVVFTRVDAAINWMRKNSLWPMPMGLACCAIELMATASSRFDISRFGAEVMRFSPRQSDVMIVAGTVTYKMSLAVKRVWDQMPEPKWCIAMGACASSGGMYRSYSVLQGIDRLIPVDVYISGCPPRPEALIQGLIKLQEKIDAEESLSDLKVESAEKPHSVTVELADLRAVMKYCYNKLELNFLLDVSSVDNSDEEPRFMMVYELTKVDDSVHLRVKAPVTEKQAEDAVVPTVSDIWATANWHEREVYDMMGIRFAGHPDMRRILMWEGYPYHPLRKEFPLAGLPTDLPEVASTGVAPMADGPFVTSAGAVSRVDAEPRARH